MNKFFGVFAALVLTGVASASVGLNHMPSVMGLGMPLEVHQNKISLPFMLDVMSEEPFTKYVALYIRPVGTEKWRLACAWTPDNDAGGKLYRCRPFAGVAKGFYDVRASVHVNDPHYGCSRDTYDPLVLDGCGGIRDGLEPAEVI